MKDDGNVQMLEIIRRMNEVASESELSALLEATLKMVADIFSAAGGIIYILDQAMGYIEPRASLGFIDTHGKKDETQSILTDFASAALRCEHPLNDQDFKALPKFIGGMGEISNAQAYPMVLKGKPIGVIILFNFQEKIPELMEGICNRMVTEFDKAVRLESSRIIYDRQKALTTIIGNIGATLDRDQILRLIIESARELLNVEACSLFLVDEDAGDIVLCLASNINSNVLVERIRIPYGKGIIGYVIQSGETVIVDNVATDTRHYTKVDKTSGFETRSIMAMPLRARTVQLGGNLGEMKERIVGGIEAINKISGRFLDDDSHMLATLTDQAATVLEIARLYSETNELFLDVIQVLTSAIDAKDPYTEGHSQRVSEFSVEIALEMGIPKEVVHQIHIGGLLHDVGKIGIPDSIITKPGRLTNEEYSKMKEHPAIGARIMSQVRRMREALPALSGHHERLDGNGYPQGLSSDQIQVTSRIVAVADVFDAMTSDRPYRKALPAEAAFEYLTNEIGRNFDGECVDALIRAYKNEKIRTQAERSDYF